MKKSCISKDWYAAAPGVYGKYPVENGYAKIDLPNDYAVLQPRSPHNGAGNGAFAGGAAKYVKFITLPENLKHYILNVDGAYMLSEVYWNGNKVAFHPHGYTSFLVDLTKFARTGTNKLVIMTNANQPSSRWYSGAGIYRDVFLYEGGLTRVEPWDLFVTTPDLSTVKADCDVSTDKDAYVQVRADIYNAKNEFVTGDTISVYAKKDEKTPVTFTMNVENATPWDLENPYLYTIRIRVLDCGTVVDESETTFGIRTITADTENGLRLNGKTIKLRGGCIHHDHGVLGAADYPAATYRKISRLKAAGFNAVRNAHNPPSQALLDVCDRLGIVMMDEAFDMWNCRKTQNDYHYWFADRWAEDIKCMVLAARNHPSVFSYSIGNEIVERDGNSEGAEWSAKLSAEIRKYDTTRFVTSGVCGMWERPEAIDPPDYVEGIDIPGLTKYENWPKLTEGYMKPLDIVGYNYIYTRYKVDHELYPDRVIWGSETHALKIYESWAAVMENNHVLGDFTWTAYDNLGEAAAGRGAWAREDTIYGISLKPYPWRSCFQGDLDLCGYRRPQSFYREAVWVKAGSLSHDHVVALFTTHPEHYGEAYTGTGWHWWDVLDTWTFEDKYLGKPVKCDVYTDADEVEFVLNKVSKGRVAVDRVTATMDIPYEKGTLIAIAYKDGTEVGRSVLSTVGGTYGVKVTPETSVIKADNRDLCYFDITVTDCNGNRVPDSKAELTALVSGGELLGIFSGDPKNEDQYTSNTCHAFEGRAVAIIRTKTPGTVTVNVGGANLYADTASILAE